jgi:REP element-mobilizing transposase RayT
MTNYRRNFLGGGSFFFTVNLADRWLRLLTEHIDELRAAFRETRRHHPFTTDAVVVSPDHHLHAIWTLPEGDADFATRWRLIKSAFSRNLAIGEPIQRAVPPKVSAVSGSGVIGSTRSAMRTISRVMSITSTSIRSSMGLSRGSGIGRIRRSISW